MPTDFEKLVDGKYLSIATFDIETTELKADRGYTICACIKEVYPDNLKGPTHTVRIDDRRNSNKFSDKWVLEKTNKLLNSFDLLVGWYSSAFDFPFVNARSMFHHIPVPNKNFRRDLCFVSRGNLQLSSHKLGNVCKFLFGETEKTPFVMDIWYGAVRAEKKAIDYIVEHCEKDVLETEKTYKELMPLLGKLRRA